jgi:hypothetical protein
LNFGAQKVKINKIRTTNHKTMAKSREPGSGEISEEGDDRILHVDFSQGKDKIDAEAGPASKKEGRILRVDFSKGGDKAGSKNGSPSESSSREDALARLSEVLGTLFMETAPEGVDAKEWSEAAQMARNEILPFLESREGQISTRAYNDNFARIQKFSNRALVKSVLSSGEGDWTAKPAYYKPLAEEMKIRSQYPGEIKE